MTLNEAMLITEIRNNVSRLLQFIRNNKEDEHLIDRISVELMKVIDDLTVVDIEDDDINDLK